MPEIILHQWEISPYCGKVRRLLRHKGLPFQVREYNGLRVLAAGKLSPAGKLPVLEYDGERIQDSSRIAAFIEERHPEPALIPKSGREAHLVHIFEDWADESLYWYEVYFRFMWTEAADKAFAVIQQGRPAWEKKLIVTSAVPMMRQKLRAQGIGKYDAATVTGQFLEHLRHLEGLLAEGDWLVGGQCTLADIAVVSQLAEVKRTSHLAPRFADFPRVSAWMARVGD